MLAGELDDRWLGCASNWAGGKSGHHSAQAEKGNAPGNARGRGCASNRVTESATENIPPAQRIPVIARRKTFGMSSNDAHRR